jgi:phosphate-selective porin OprO and OprP
VSRQEVALAGAVDELEHEAFQGVLSYVLTGGSASYKGVRPTAPFVPGEGGGAFEVALRYGTLDVDDAAFPVYADPDESVSELSDVGIALNWYLTPNARLSASHDRTTFEGGAAGGGDRDDEKAFFTRIQLSF